MRTGVKKERKKKRKKKRSVKNEGVSECEGSESVVRTKYNKVRVTLCTPEQNALCNKVYCRLLDCWVEHCSRAMGCPLGSLSLSLTLTLTHSHSLTHSIIPLLPFLSLSGSVLSACYASDTLSLSHSHSHSHSALSLLILTSHPLFSSSLLIFRGYICLRPVGGLNESRT